MVGYSQAADGAEHAFLWQNGAMRDLNPEGASSSQADASRPRSLTQPLTSTDTTSIKITKRLNFTEDAPNSGRIF